MRIPPLRSTALLFVCALPLATGAAQVRVMPLGDSITEAFAPQTSFRRPLWLDLMANGHCVDFVGGQTGVAGDPLPGADFDPHHEGHVTWRADQIAGNILTYTAAAQPDIVLLAAGANDLIQGQGVTDAIGDVGLIIDGLRQIEPEVTVLLAQYFSPDSADPLAAPIIAQFPVFNGEIALLAAAKHSPLSPVLLVDLATGFDAQVDTYDGVHPNAQGEQKLADAWRAVLQPLLVTEPAEADSYGNGLAGTLGEPTLSSAAPVIGTQPTLTLGNPSGGATAAVLLYGFAPAAIPKGWGSDLLVAVTGTVSLDFPGPADIELTVPIPADGAFCGVAAYFQLLVADAGAPHGIATSAGLEWVLGAQR